MQTSLLPLTISNLHVLVEPMGDFIHRFRTTRSGAGKHGGHGRKVKLTNHRMLCEEEHQWWYDMKQSGLITNSNGREIKCNTGHSKQFVYNNKNIYSLGT